MKRHGTSCPANGRTKRVGHLRDDRAKGLSDVRFSLQSDDEFATYARFLILSRTTDHGEPTSGIVWLGNAFSFAALPLVIVPTILIDP